MAQAAWSGVHHSIFKSRVHVKASALPVSASNLYPGSDSLIAAFCHRLHRGSTIASRVGQSEASAVTDKHTERVTNCREKFKGSRKQFNNSTDAFFTTLNFITGINVWWSLTAPYWRLTRWWPRWSCWEQKRELHNNQLVRRKKLLEFKTNDLHANSVNYKHNLICQCICHWFLTDVILIKKKKRKRK